MGHFGGNSGFCVRPETTAPLFADPPFTTHVHQDCVPR